MRQRCERKDPSITKKPTCCRPIWNTLFDECNAICWVTWPMCTTRSVDNGHDDTGQASMVVADGLAHMWTRVGRRIQVYRELPAKRQTQNLAKSQFRRMSYCLVAHVAPIILRIANMDSAIRSCGIHLRAAWLPECYDQDQSLKKSLKISNLRLQSHPRGQWVKVIWA